MDKTIGTYCTYCPGRTTDSPLKRTISISCFIHTVHRLIIGYRYARNMLRFWRNILKINLLQVRFSLNEHAVMSVYKYSVKKYIIPPVWDVHGLALLELAIMWYQRFAVRGKTATTNVRLHFWHMLLGHLYYWIRDNEVTSPTYPSGRSWYWRKTALTLCESYLLHGWNAL